MNQIDCPSDLKCVPFLDAYIGLNDHPGVGQTHVALGAEQLQPLFQILLSVVINLEQMKQKKRERNLLRKCIGPNHVKRDELIALCSRLKISPDRAGMCSAHKRQKACLLVLLSSVTY